MKHNHSERLAALAALAFFFGEVRTALLLIFLFLFALKGARFAVGSHYAGAESFRFDGGWPPLLVFRTFGRSVVLSWVPSRFRLFGA